MLSKLARALGAIPKWIAIGLIMFYRFCISPLFPSCCRFVPTCSQYGLTAFKRYGFCKGLVLTCKRIMRCRPGGPHGYDPVP
ncbi:MAG: membrane protein insertion efficiency factor YidD [Eggerthellaceae bacterium]|nr:membrane protein insertion efficiency factor YidD [Eggerthellaceae bacterium]